MTTIDDLRAKLMEAARKYDGAKETDAEGWPTRREATIDALDALYEHLTQPDDPGQGFDRARRVLNGLREALVAVDAGNQHPLFQPSRDPDKSGTPPIEVTAKMHRAAAIAVVEGLKRGGMKLQDALQAVANHLRIDKRVLQSWREEKHRSIFTGDEPGIESTYRLIVDYTKKTGQARAFEFLDLRLGEAQREWARDRAR
jgi:hypothetical protein